jgi:hypothetical protein
MPSEIVAVGDDALAAEVAVAAAATRTSVRAVLADTRSSGDVKVHMSFL